MSSTSDEGIMLEGSAVLSACAWATARALDPRPSSDHARTATAKATAAAARSTESRRATPPLTGLSTSLLSRDKVIAPSSGRRVLADMGDDERRLTIPLLKHGGEGFPADVDLAPSADRYVGFYENEHGEQLIFLRERGEQPRLYHGDYGWKPVSAVWPERQRLGSLAPWVAGDLVLDQGEVLWLIACLEASGALREERREISEGPLDRLLIQGIDEVFQRQREHFDQQSSVAEKALERWKKEQGTSPSFEEEHYAEGAILVVLGLNSRQRRPRRGVTKEIRERIEREAPEVAREVQA
jgi:hypothetical protein